MLHTNNDPMLKAIFDAGYWNGKYSKRSNLSRKTVHSFLTTGTNKSNTTVYLGDKINIECRIPEGEKLKKYLASQNIYLGRCSPFIDGNGVTFDSRY